MATKGCSPCLIGSIVESRANSLVQAHTTPHFARLHFRQGFAEVVRHGETIKLFTGTADAEETECFLAQELLPLEVCRLTCHVELVDSALPCVANRAGVCYGCHSSMTICPFDGAAGIVTCAHGSKRVFVAPRYLAMQISNAATEGEICRFIMHSYR